MRLCPLWLVAGCWPWIDAARPGVAPDDTDVAPDTDTETDPDPDTETDTDDTDPEPAPPAGLRLIVLASIEAPQVSRVRAYLTDDPAWAWWSAWSTGAEPCHGSNNEHLAMSAAVSATMLGQGLLAPPSCAALVRSDLTSLSCEDAMATCVNNGGTGVLPLNCPGDTAGEHYLFSGNLGLLEVGVSYDLLLGDWPALGAAPTRIGDVVRAEAQGKVRFTGLQAEEYPAVAFPCEVPVDDLPRVTAPYGVSWVDEDPAAHIVWSIYPADVDFPQHATCAAPDVGSASLFGGAAFASYVDAVWQDGQVLCTQAARGEESPQRVQIGDWNVQVEGVFLQSAVTGWVYDAR